MKLKGGMTMKLKDLLALAKQGYSLSDIKELEALAEADEPEKEEETEHDEPNEPCDEDEEEPEKTDVDYKKLYEQSQADLKKAQEANRKQNAGDDQATDEDVLNNLIKDWN